MCRIECQVIRSAVRKVKRSECSKKWCCSDRLAQRTLNEVEEATEIFGISSRSQIIVIIK